MAERQQELHDALGYPCMPGEYYPEDIKEKLKLLAGPDGPTIYQVMKAKRCRTQK
jgi:hypothetical protein